jgi:hypothetical protein
MSQQSGRDPGTRPDADRSHPKEQEQLAQEMSYPDAGTDTNPAQPVSAPDAGTTSPPGGRASGGSDAESTPRGLADERPTVPEPLEPVPGVEEGTRSRQVAGDSGDNDLPPVSDAEHGGDLPLEPPRPPSDDVPLEPPD